MTKQLEIDKEEVAEAWKSVRRAGGAAGYDKKSIKDVEGSLEASLYKIWNRMSSGSYIAQPVLGVKIPKAKGGYRLLGIPTVLDRVAQTVVKARLEAVVEPIFHEESYAYRPNKSALDAVGVCRERCFKHDWLLEIDIKGYFDNIDHDIMMQILKKHTKDRVTLLYAERFLKADLIDGEGIEVRIKGTPQGGVVSPLLANLYLHEAYDAWMQEKYAGVKFERYADDIVVHCETEEIAHKLMKEIGDRLKEYGLELNLEKSRVVYTSSKNDQNHRGHEVPRKFTFLGYDFKPRNWKGKQVFTPGISTGALKKIRTEMREQWRLSKRGYKGLEEIAKDVESKIRGWIMYYGKYRRSALVKLAETIDNYLAQYLKKRRKSCSSWKKSWDELRRVKERKPLLFSHWHMITVTDRRAV